jgi:LysM repeat protein
MENNNTIDQTSENESTSRHAVIHKVRNGETLQILAKKYNTDTKTLISINHLKNGQLKTGQTLKINNAVYKKNGRIAATRGKSIKISSHRKILASRNNSSRHISARSHIRLE